MDKTITKLTKLASQIDLTLKNILDEESTTSNHIHPIIKDFITKNKPLNLSGGKRIRGSLAYYSYMMCGGTKLDDFLRVSSSIELMHTYLLVHDDIFDKAPKRRSHKTLHKVFEHESKVLGNHYGAKHFGTSIAINAGDFLNHLSNNVLASSNFPSDRKVNAIIKLNRSVNDVVYGQVLDIYAEILDNVGESYIKLVQHYKTGVYTYELPLHIGALLAGKNGEVAHILTEYAIPAGIAYQIQDDVLGIFGKEDKTGKSTSSDIIKGKKTLLTIKAYEKATKAQKRVLDRVLGNNKASDEDIKDVKQIIIDTDSLKYSIWLARLFLTRSSKALSSHKVTQKFKDEGLDFLVGLNEYLYHRDLENTN